jgi:hypothetical protein
MADQRLGRPRNRGFASPTRPADAVPAPQYDRMRAPVWTHNPAPPARAGADAHKGIGSRGYRC